MNSDYQLGLSKQKKTQHCFIEIVIHALKRMEIEFQNSHWPDTKPSGFHIKTFRILMSQIKKKKILINLSK